MPVTSRRVQLTNYALLEYVYADTEISTSSAKPLLLTNAYNNQYQFVNSATAASATGNTLDNSATPVSSDNTKWVYLTTQTNVPAIKIDPNLSLTDQSSYLLNEQYYDTVKVHLAAGYDFAGLDGFIVDIQWVEWTPSGAGGKKFTAAAQVYLNSAPNIQYNPNPIFLGDKFYDRYITFSFPSLAIVNQNFWAAPTAPNTIGYNYTHNNVGFSKNSLIYSNLYEIQKTTVTNNNSYFIIGNIYNTSFSPSDVYSYVGANIIENTNYNFFEYYPTYNGGYIQEYLANLNAAPGGAWVIINQLDVYEQAGTNMVLTSSMTLLQQNNFNEAAILRPVLRNSAYDYSFTIQYTMRLMNKVDNSEIIRIATVTSTNPQNYGYSLERINVLEGFVPVAVYNKIEQVQTANLTNSLLGNQGAYGYGTPKIVTNTLYVNSYVDINYVSIDSSTTVGQSLGQTVYPQGLNYIFLSKFVNYVKFKLFTVSKDKKQNIALNLAANGMNISLSFIYDDGTKTYFAPQQDLSAADPSAGEVLFRIDDITSAKLLNQSNKGYYIINQNNLGDEVLIYSGNFDSQDNSVKIMATINQTLIEDLNKQVGDLQAAQYVLLHGATGTSISAGNSSASSSPSSTLINSSASQVSSAVDNASSYVTSSAQGITNAIKTAADNSVNDPNSVGLNINLNVPDIPGVTPSLGSPVNIALKPNVIKPSNPLTSTSTLIQRLSQGAIANVTKQTST